MYDAAMTWLSRFGVSPLRARRCSQVDFRLAYDYLAPASVVVPVKGTEAA
jgi:hypothetical protein